MVLAPTTRARVFECFESQRKSLIKVENNGHKQRLRGLLTRAEKKVPSWLDRSARSVLEETDTMRQDSVMVTSNPARVARVTEMEEILPARGLQDSEPFCRSDARTVCSHS